MMAFNKTSPQFDERIKNFRAELDALIDARAAEESKIHGIPHTVARNVITRGIGCQCEAYLEMAGRR